MLMHDRLEVAIDFAEYWRILRKRRWVVLGVAFGVFLAVAVTTLLTRPVYRSQALIQIQPSDPKIFAFQDDSGV